MHPPHSTRGRWGRALGSLLILLGVGLLTWYSLETWARHRAQRRALEDLAEIEGAIDRAEDADHPELPMPALPPTRPGEPIGRILIPSVDVDVVAFEGIDRETLRRGAGHFPGTAHPGGRGNASFAAHRDSFFRGLRRIELGDRIRIETPTGEYHYTVSETYVVEPHQVEVVESRGAPEVTLVTCYPFDYVGPAPRRFIVHGELEEAANGSSAGSVSP